MNIEVQPSAQEIPQQSQTETAMGVGAKTKKTVSDLTIKFADLIVAAFGIVSALSWNDAVKSLFTTGGIFQRFSKGGPWVVAFVITLFALAIGYWRSKLLPTVEKKTS